MHWRIDGLAVCLVSIAVTGIILPQILRIAYRKQLFDLPDQRKVHSEGIPRLGGLAFMPSIVVSLCLVLGLEILTNHLSYEAFNGTSSYATSHLQYITVYASEMRALCFGLCAVMVMYLVGIADDFIGVRYPVKFAAQTCSALLLVAGDVRIESLHGLLGIYELPIVPSYVITVLLVLMIVNSINLIDGIDGLASGLSAIAMAFYAMNFVLSGHWTFTLLAFATLGTLVPFVYYNVFGNPEHGNKIFMGDTGSLTTGMLLAFMALTTGNLTLEGLYGFNIVVVAFAPLAIPCLDVMRVFVHRLARGTNPFLPDKAHIHHKLLALGCGQRTAMISILLSSVLLVMFNLWLTRYAGALLILSVDIALWTLLNWQLTLAIRHRERKLGIKTGYK